LPLPFVEDSWKMRIILDWGIMIPLHELSAGDVATVAAIHADAALRSRLAALGVRIGQRVRMVRKGRFAGPLHIRLGTTDLILRRRQAGQIEVAR
jgi:Fe2+ transport system protein FeoA